MPNRLADETSPYLLQHAHNPVDWYPWGAEALGRAKDEDRPILLSVGYSACHWCHVMERESFEDPATAAEMNRDFVNIKVDREERPDLDEIYMKAVQAFSGGHGGWPMTVFLTPDGRPFLGGTYFPPTPRHGMPSFRQLMAHAVRVYRERRDAVEHTAGRVLDGIRPWSNLPVEAPELGTEWLDAIAEAAADSYDPLHGGFGHAPKFPPHATMSVLLAHHHRTGAERSLQMVIGTLDGMAKGGTYDVVGGGFARYSVDERWLIPHFEKMLYDNALLAPIYADAWRVTGSPRFARIARETLGWMLREMRDDAGGLYAALDADSEGEEGLFYAWTPEQIAAVAGEDAPELCRLLEVTAGGTFEHGRSVLRLERPLEALPDADRTLFERWRGPLLESRSKRIWPGLDDKIIAAWNGLAISALARVGAALGEERYLEAARSAASFVLDGMTRDGRLHRTWKADRVGAPGFLDDHGAMLLALVDLWEATFEPRWLREAVALADRTVALFWDEGDGGFFYTGHDAEPLVARSKNLVGGAIPSGNGMVALALVRLDALCDRPDLGERADRVLRSYRTLLNGAPRALGAEALAGMWRATGGQEIAVVGAGGDALLAEVRDRYLPFAVLASADQPDTELLPWLSGRQSPDGARAFLCERRTCRAPTDDPAELAAQLDGLSSR